MLLSSENLNATEKQFITVLNNTFIYVLAYFTGYVTHLLATIVVAVYLNIPVTLFTGHMQFKIIGEWEQSNVIATYAAGPLLCLILGGLFFSFFSRYKFERGLVKVFCLWGYLHCMNFFFGSLVAGTIVKSGFWYAVRWMLVSDVVPIFIAFLFLLLLIVIGVTIAPGFLFSCDSKTLMQFKNREKMLISTVFSPWILGSLLIIAIKFPDNRLYELLQFLTLGILLIPVYIVNQNILFSQVVREPLKTKIAWSLLILVAIAGLSFHLLLYRGIDFGV